MAIRNLKKTPRLETLERRECLSAAGMVHASAIRPHPFTGTGQGQVISLTQGSGVVNIVANLNGRATQIGRFRGEVDSSIGGTHLDSAVTLTGANGDVLDLSLGANLGKPNKKGAPFRGTYTIVGGTGRFAQASGSGTLTGLISPNGALSFQIRGKIVD